MPDAFTIPVRRQMRWLLKPTLWQPFAVIVWRSSFGAYAHAGGLMIGLSFLPPTFGLSLFVTLPRHWRLWRLFNVRIQMKDTPS